MQRHARIISEAGVTRYCADCRGLQRQAERTLGREQLFGDARPHEIEQPLGRRRRARRLPFGGDEPRAALEVVRTRADQS